MVYKTFLLQLVLLTVLLNTSYSFSTKNVLENNIIELLTVRFKNNNSELIESVFCKVFQITILMLNICLNNILITLHSVTVTFTMHMISKFIAFKVKVFH